MQETVTSSGETKSLFSTYLELVEARDAQAALQRQITEERYLRRTQRIYEFHERQRREAAELRRCLEYVSQHAHVLETVLRGAATPPPGEEGASGGVPLSAGLVRQAAALQRCMAQCVANAAQIRALLSAAHRDQMDAMLTKMERELSAWTKFVQRALDATSSSESVVENLHNMIAEQRRCVLEVSASSVFRSLTAEEDPASPVPASPDPAPPAPAHAPASPTPGPSTAACSTPIARD